MKKNELTTVAESFQLTTGMEEMDEELRAELQDEMADLDSEAGIMARKIKVASGGAKFFIIEGDDEDSEESVAQFEAVILFTHRMNSYWEREEGSDQTLGTAPNCSAIDAKTGLNRDTGVVQTCEDCPLNQFSEDGSGKPCKNMRRIYMMLSGRPYLYVLTVPPTSLRDVNKKLARIMGMQTPYTRLVCRFSLEKATSKGGNPYCKIVVDKAFALDQKYFKETAAMRENIKSQYKTVAVTDEDLEPATAKPEVAPTNAAKADGRAEDLPYTDDTGFMEVPEGDPEEMPFN